MDRELLEWAAKAVGYIDDATTEGNAHGLHKGDNEGAPNPFYVVGPDGWVDWNPITDDGDALRLAVKLDITIQQNFGGVLCYDTPDFADKSQKMIEVYEDKRPDPCAATRRAIVRAAAEIGKSMPDGSGGQNV